MDKKQILNRAYVAKVSTKSYMRAKLDKEMSPALVDSVYDIVSAALDYNYKQLSEELDDALKVVEA